MSQFSEAEQAGVHSDPLQSHLSDAFDPPSSLLHAIRRDPHSRMQLGSAPFALNSPLDLGQILVESWDNFSTLYLTGLCSMVMTRIACL